MATALPQRDGPSHVGQPIGEDMGVILGVFGGRWVTGEGLLVMVPPGPEKDARMIWSPCLIRSAAPEGRVDLKLGHPLVDDFLAFADARCRPNTVLAAGFDLKVFLTIIEKDPVEVTRGDVLEFIRAQRSAGDPKVVRLADGESGLSSRTIQRRLSSLSSFYSFLVVRGDVKANPVPRGLSTRRARDRGGRGVPLIRTPRTLPRVAEPAEIDALLVACRRFRDQAMFEAMVFGGLRRCEVLGLRLGDLDGARRQVFIVEGKGGPQRQIPISGGNGPGCAGSPATRCATPASPDSAKPAWNSKRCRLKPGTDRWTRPGSTSIWPTVGWPPNTTKLPR